MMPSIAADEMTLTVVKVPASTRPGGSADRHITELAAKQSIATTVSMTARRRIRLNTSPRENSAINF
jgi:hypothetical protein